MLNRLYSLLCLFFPCAVLAFLLTGPHNIFSALAWTLPLWLLVLGDWLSPKINLQSPLANKALQQNSSHYFNGLLYLLAILQFCNIFFMLVYASQLQWQSGSDITTSLINLIALRIMVGTSSGSSGIIVAHELIHRHTKYLQFLGRLLMCTVCYEHFVIAHKQCHHPRVAQLDDITTARRGEGFEAYCRRVYLAHWRYSWKYEMQRLGLAGKRWTMNICNNQVLQGMVLEVLLLSIIIFAFGAIAAALFLYCAYAGARLLEAINYFQHWGLGKQTTAIAWVNDSWLTYYVLLGMSYHVSHHEDANKHYQAITYVKHGPKMPYGYFVMNLWVKVNNRSYQKMALRELARFS